MSRPDWFPEIDFEGRVDLDSLRRSDVEPLALWITAVLRQEDPRVIGSRDDEPYIYLEKLYHKLAGGTRESFRDALLLLLAELTGKRSADNLKDPPPDDLLLLIAEIFSGLEEELRTAPVPYLREMADEEPDLRPPGIHYRVVQTLAALRYGEDPIFWHNQYERGGDEYAGVTFDGLLLFDMREAFRWVNQNADRPAILEALLGALPLIQEEKPEQRGLLLDLLQDLLHRLPQLGKDRLLEFAEVFELPLNHASPPVYPDETEPITTIPHDQDLSSPFPIDWNASLFVRWDSAELNDLAHGMNLDDLISSTDRRERLADLDSELRHSLPPELRNLDVPNAASTLLATCRKLVESGSRGMSAKLVGRIIDSADRCINEVTSETKFVDVLAVASMTLQDANLNTDSW